MTSREEILRRVDEARQLRSRGLEVKAVANRLGVNERTAYRYLKAAGATQPRRPHSAEKLDFARRLLEDGCPYAEVARTTGIHPQLLSKWFPGLGAGAASGPVVRNVRKVLDKL